MNIEENKNVLAEYLSNGTVLIHPDLKKDSYLYNTVIEHESLHAQSQGFFDIFIELKDLLNVKKQFKLSLFLLRHPKLIINQLLPYTKYKNEIYPDYFKIVTVSSAFALGIIGGILL